MTETEFWLSTPRTFFYRLEGFSELNNIKEQAEWERIRWAVAYLLQPHAKKNRRIKPKDLITFPWETSKKKVKPLTKDDLKRLDEFKDKVDKVKKWEPITKL
jgi:hypothetical protein